MGAPGAVAGYYGTTNYYNNLLTEVRNEVILEPQAQNQGLALAENSEINSTNALLENGPYIKDGKPKGRPTLSGVKKLQFETEVYNRCIGLDGVLRDPNTNEIINWVPGQARSGIVDFGHTAGNGYSSMFQNYRNGIITLEELKEFQFNSNNYQLEIPSTNRSHLYE
jgi:hypothetical protein